MVFLTYPAKFEFLRVLMGSETTPRNGFWAKKASKVRIVIGVKWI